MASNKQWTGKDAWRIFVRQLRSGFPYSPKLIPPSLRFAALWLLIGCAVDAAATELRVQPAFWYEVGGHTQAPGGADGERCAQQLNNIQFRSPQSAFEAWKTCLESIPILGANGVVIMTVTLENFRAFPEVGSFGANYVSSIINGRRVQFGWDERFRFFPPSPNLPDQIYQSGQVSLGYNCPSGFTVDQQIGPVTGDGFTPVSVSCVNKVPEAPIDFTRSCGFGNPVLAETGTKIQTEADYVSPDGDLRFERTYRSDRGTFRHQWQIELNDFASSGTLPSCYDGFHRQPTATGGEIWLPYCFPYSTENQPAPRRVDVVDGTGMRRSFQLDGDSGIGVDGFNRDALTRTNGLWRLTSNRTATQDIFSANGRLTERREASGRGVTIGYSDATTAQVIAPRSGLPIRISDSFGRSLQLRYNADGLLTRLIDPDGKVTDYAYEQLLQTGCFGEACWRLVKVTYPDGRSRRYHYDEAQYIANPTGRPNLLTGVTDENGSRLSVFSYDGVRAVSTQWAGGINRYQLAYPRENTATVTDPLGTQRTVTFTDAGGLVQQASQSQPAGSGCGPASSSITYDTNANVTSRTDFNGHKTCFAYDLSRNLETQRVEGLASNADCATTLATPSAGARVIRTQWHPDWRLAVKIAEPKKITTTVYNGQGASCAPSSALVDGKPVAVVCKRTEQATTDDSGSQGFAATGTGTPRTWSYTYTTYGRVLTETDPNGQTTKTTYHPDDDPDLGKRGQIATVTNPVGHVTRYTDYNAHGQPTRMVDPNGLVTLLTYDLRQRLTSRKVGDELTTYTYDPVGQLTQITLPDGAKLYYTYDAAHRLIGLADHKGDKIDYTLDAAGNRINEKLTDPSGALVKNIARVVDSLNRVQEATGEAPEGTQPYGTFR